MTRLRSVLLVLGTWASGCAAATMSLDPGLAAEGTRYEVDNAAFSGSHRFGPYEVRRTPFSHASGSGVSFGDHNAAEERRRVNFEVVADGRSWSGRCEFDGAHRASKEPIFGGTITHGRRGTMRCNYGDWRLELRLDPGGRPLWTGHLSGPSTRFDVQSAHTSEQSSFALSTPLGFVVTRGTTWHGAVQTTNRTEVWLRPDGRQQDVATALGVLLAMKRDLDDLTD